MIHLQVLTGDQVKQMHEATLVMLSETGIKLSHAGARELFFDHGATVHQERDERILLPPELVEKCLAKCPPTVRLQGRNPDQAVELGEGNWFAHNVGGVPNVFEGDTRRPAQRDDVIKATQLLDALPNVSTITPHFTPQDVPDEKMALWMHYDTIINTTKPIRAPGTHTAHDIRMLAEMADIACPELGRRALTVGVSPISPLNFPDNIVETMIETARMGMILGPLPCPIMGATAPMSMAGGIVQQNAEVLASVVLGQLVNPGLAVIYKGRLSLMDPFTGLSVWGNPELGMISAATVQMGHYYKLPVDVYGLSTNSHVLDIQNGYERTSSALLPVLAGADEISGVGEMDGGVNSSLAQMVIDNEILSSIKRVRRGFSVNDDALALDVVATVMNDSGNFLAEKHTVRYLRGGEMLRTKLAERGGWDEWEATGRSNILLRAQAQVDSILAEPAGKPLDEKRQSAMRALID